jgi:hypothetical protein
MLSSDVDDVSVSPNYGSVFVDGDIVSTAIPVSVRTSGASLLEQALGSGLAAIQHSSAVALGLNELKSAVISDLTSVQSGAYTKAAADALLAAKADADSVYTKTEIDASIADLALSSDVYTKTESDGKYALSSDLSDYVLTASLSASIDAAIGASDAVLSSDLEGLVDPLISTALSTYTTDTLEVGYVSNTYSLLHATSDTTDLGADATPENGIWQSVDITAAGVYVLNIVSNLPEGCITCELACSVSGAVDVPDAVLRYYGSGAWVDGGGGAGTATISFAVLPYEIGSSPHINIIFRDIPGGSAVTSADLNTVGPLV